jgi:poly [ADP-ribose] polymerase
MASVKSWRLGEAGAPAFPDDFEIVKKCALQVTDIKTNHNKYYALELHRATVSGAPSFRVFTHYGRTDDLETNPNAGMKECRYAATQAEADGIYMSLYREKTSPRKGYKELSLASSRIGSQKARGTSAGEIDAKTVQRLAEQRAARGETPLPVAPKVTLDPRLADLVQYIYAEATDALTEAVNVRITAHGIETPLGILTLGQIEKGEAILQDLYRLFQAGSSNRTKMQELSSDFYTVIPHRIGRTRTAIQDAVIDSMEAFQGRQETLQLMKDMLQVNGDSGSVLFDGETDARYAALGCDIGPLDPASSTYQEIERYVLERQVKTKGIKVKSVYTLRREAEHQVFTQHIGNERLLFHGSRIQNWVGLLSRGISPAEDRGERWGSTAPTRAGSATASTSATRRARARSTRRRASKKTRFMALARVGPRQGSSTRRSPTASSRRPPAGYDSTATACAARSQDVAVRRRRVCRLPPEPAAPRVPG